MLRILGLNENIERLPASKIQEYKDAGYDVVTGYNVFRTPEYVLLNKDAIVKTKFFSEAPNNEVTLFRAPRDVLKAHSNTSTINWKDANFKSELDWSPEGWFGKAAGRHYLDGTSREYTDADISELKSHIPEYVKIERQAKANGTWLKMPDGSTWTGDPRSWVQLQSDALKQGYNKDVLWSGRQHDFNPEYTGDVWGVRGQGKIPGLQARTYATSDNGVLPLVSEDVPIISYDAKGNSWTEIFGKDEGKIYTNDVVNRDFSEGAKRVHIDNVRDPGPNFVPMSSIYRTSDKMLDYTLLGIPQNDVILAPNVIRKSLIGNNGAFANIAHRVPPVAVFWYHS